MYVYIYIYIYAAYAVVYDEFQTYFTSGMLVVYFVMYKMVLKEVYGNYLIWFLFYKMHQKYRICRLYLDETNSNLKIIANTLLIFGMLCKSMKFYFIFLFINTVLT